MRITETEIPDIDITNINKAKVTLANKIIENINPLFDDLLQEKKQEINIKLKKLKQIKSNVISNKSEIEKLFEDYKRKQKVKQLLERIDKLVSLGVISEGQRKQETIVLLKIIDNLPIEKLNLYIKDSIKTISKRFPTK